MLGRLLRKLFPADGEKTSASALDFPDFFALPPGWRFVPHYSTCPHCGAELTVYPEQAGAIQPPGFAILPQDRAVRVTWRGTTWTEDRLLHVSFLTAHNEIVRLLLDYDSALAVHEGVEMFRSRIAPVDQS